MSSQSPNPESGNPASSTSTNVDAVSVAQQQLGGRYVLIERIAAGGMGEVWAATDQVLGRRVAVKILRKELADDPNFRERFRAEARHAAGLSHVGIAAVYDYDDGTADLRAAPFLVMEYVPGEPLSSLISREGALEAEQTLDIIGQAAHALQAAHDGGVIHRDIKPGNLIVTPEGAVKITDFGISRATNSAPLTLTGSIMGTAYYISPEQASGAAVTPASDVYSLGIVAYECLSGRRPFSGDTPVSVALAQVREEPPRLPPTVPAPVAELVMRLLAKDPAERPASAGHVAGEAFALRASVAARAAAGDDQTVALAMPQALRGDGARPRDPGGVETPPHGDPSGTSVLPPRTSTDTDPGFVLPPPPDRHHWLRYAIPVALLLSALLATAVVVGDLAGRPDPAGVSQPSPSPTASATTPALIDIDASAYVGRPAEDVRAELTALGLLVDLDHAEGPGQPGTVQSVSPDGSVERGTLITVTVVRAAEDDDDKRDDEKRDDDRGKGKKKKDNGKGDD